MQNLFLEDGKYITEREVEKMSKSKYNVVNPDDICREYMEQIVCVCMKCFWVL